MSHPHTKKPVSDAKLIARTRRGDMAAYAELWRRHRSAAITVARVFTTSLEAEDLVSEAYAQVLSALQHGRGPENTAFRPYLYTVVRNLARRWGSARREVTVADFPEVVDENDSLSIQLDSLDRGMVRDAFSSLPRRWQEVLWYTEIEGMPAARIGELLGMSANSVSALAYRAREGLRLNWLQVHVAEAQRGGECAWSLEHMGEQSRGRLTDRNQARMDQHLADCESCQSVALEVREVNHQLASVLVPVILGGGAGAAWLSSLAQGGGATAATVAGGAATAAGSAAVAGAGVGVAVGAGATSVVTLVGIVGALVLIPVGPNHGAENHEVPQSVNHADDVRTHSLWESTEHPREDDPGLPATGGSSDEAETDDSDHAAEETSGPVGDTVDAVGDLVENLTGGVVTTDLDIDLSLDSPGVSTAVDVGGLNVGADVQLGGQDSGIEVTVGDILSIDLNLGGDDGLLEIGLFGLLTK